MKKNNIIKKSKDFDRIIKKRNGISNKLFILNIEDNNLNKAMFRITLTKKIGNAVIRNKLKRQTKSIIDNNKNIYQNNKNYIIIVKKEALNSNYQKMEQSIVSLFNIIKEKDNEKTEKK